MGKTIAQELFTIAEAQGGTAAGYPRTIAGAVDALTDALAGSDVDSGRTIAEAVAVMGEYIGGGGGDSVTVYVAQHVEAGEWVPFEGHIYVNDEETPRTLGTGTLEGVDYATVNLNGGDAIYFFTATDEEIPLMNVESQSLAQAANLMCFIVTSDAQRGGNNTVASVLVG